MRVFIHTLGCKVNQYETGAMETLLRERGHEICTEPQGCDAVVINTCAVTAESERKSRQAVRKYAAEAPGAVVAMCGCCSQISPDTARDIGADLVYGSGDRRGFVADLERVFNERTRIDRVDDAMRRRVFEPLPSGNEAGRTRAMLKIEDGCVNFCTYCVIPYARGPVRSLPLDGIAAEARSLYERGFREIVVTGIEIASYGRDLPGKPTLTDAVRTVSENAPDVRIRLGSLEPRAVTEEFCSALKDMKNVCPHFHLSLQSGSDGVLSRMKRKYGTALFYGAVTLLRKHFPDCAIAADLIVGFPGETEAEFEETMAFIEKCAFSSMHIFPYSIRPGTVAADMPGQLTNDTKRRRAKLAGSLAAEMENAYLKSCVGKTLTVLFETEKDGVSRGHAPNYCEVAVNASGLRGKCVDVTVTSAENGTLFGRIDL